MENEKPKIKNELKQSGSDNSGSRYSLTNLEITTGGTSVSPADVVSTLKGRTFPTSSRLVEEAMRLLRTESPVVERVTLGWREVQIVPQRGSLSSKLKSISRKIWSLLGHQS